MMAKSAMYRAGLAGIFFLLVLAHYARSQSSPIQTVYSLLQAHEFAKAESVARSYLEGAPDDCQMHTMLGIAFRGEGKADQAYTSFSTAARLCPRSLPALEGAAEIAYSQHLPDAEDRLKQVLSVRPDDPTTNAMLGALLARSGNCEGSVESYAKAITVIQRNPAALRQYAGCLMTLDKPSDAVSISSQLLTVEENPANRLLLADAQRGAGTHKEALATLQPLLAPTSHEARAFLLAAEIAESENDTPQAVAWLRQAIQADPKRVQSYIYFAEVSFNHDSFQVGIDMLNLGLGQIPADARLLLARGVLEVQLAHLDAALADFEEAHRLEPKLSFAEDAIGVLFSQKHDSSAALAWFEQKSKAEPNDPLLQYLYAEALSEDSQNNDAQTTKAVAAAQKAVALEASYQPARDLLCVLLLRQGNLQAVVEQANEATTRNPYDEVALYQQMLAERKLNHRDAARELVQRLEKAKAHNKETGKQYRLREETSGHASTSD